MAKAAPCPLPEDLAPLLPGYSFADAYQVEAPAGLESASRATRHIFSRQPGWIASLLRLRDALVAPFGLKGVDAAPDGAIGGFPVVSESGQRVVLGFDDRHLDFRIVIDAVPGEHAAVIRTTTLVKPHNLAGRAYLAFVLPFHRAIVPRMLNRLG
jgi:hypothetical protein